MRRKLNAMPAVFEGKKVLLVDDSIVRGTTMSQIVEMVRKAGAVKVSGMMYRAPCPTSPLSLIWYRAGVHPAELCQIGLAHGL